ncbi:(deoxy)nucleoside triphosphate pyrophosphohydrolase [Terricaulis sp.]|uniref:(deoxy)nucleoside triphosphate pyrophosphohydrolase n=1 Tax=Terricaulis sp. TaxID=2768686 RepID=UPI003783997C
MQIGDSPGSSRRLLLVVAAAMFDGAGRVLITQRPNHKALGGLWEFPGGKVDAGESPEAALIRELKEELEITVEPDALDPFAFASHAYADFHLLMPLYAVTRWHGTPVPHVEAAQALAWVKPSALPQYPMPPADIVLVERIMQRERA